MSRTLYDTGVAVSHSPALVGLARGTSLHLNPWDADHLGVPDGTEVEMASPKLTVRVPIRRDAGVLRGVAWLPSNQRDLDVNRLLDAGERANDITVDTVGEGAG